MPISERRDEMSAVFFFKKNFCPWIPPPLADEDNKEVKCIHPNSFPYASVSVSVCPCEPRESFHKLFKYSRSLGLGEKDKRGIIGDNVGAGKMRLGV